LAETIIDDTQYGDGLLDVAKSIKPYVYQYVDVNFEGK
jgi:hypothetical protein